MATILIGGGSGLIGARLSELLQKSGHEVRHFSRSQKKNSPYPTYVWDVQAGTYDPAAFVGVTHVVNFAGAGIADQRWTDKRKRVIIKSRTQSTALLQKGIAEHGNQVQAYLAASAIGYYGNRGESLLTETDSSGDDFLSESVIAWENATHALTKALGLPTLIVRIGIVLSPQGGALPKMMLPLNFFTSTYFGDGQQWYAWIHLDDVCRIFMRGIKEDDFRGIYNGVAPHPVRNKELAEALITATDKPAVLMPAPAFALKLALGEMSATVMNSAKVSAKKLEQSGFRFAHPQLVSALEDLLQ